MLLVAIYFIVLQFMMMVAITLLFSTFSSPIFSAIFAFALFVIGTFGNDLRNFAAMSHGATKWLATGTAYIMPNFASLNVISQTAHEQSVGGAFGPFQHHVCPALFHCRNGCGGAGF